MECRKPIALISRFADCATTSQGLPTNAVYGFAIMLKRVMEKYPPDYICVALDSPERTARHAQYDLYKATRKKMPARSRAADAVYPKVLRSDAHSGVRDPGP